jgi:hypothetical protein
MRSHRCWLRQVAPVRYHDDGRSDNGHDAAAEGGYQHDPPTAAADHPAAGTELCPVLSGLLYPAAAPDLDCADVNGSNFTVRPPDPHGFDGNSDGVGCES